MHLSICVFATTVVSLGGEHLDKLLVVENPVAILVRLIDHLLHLLLRQLVT